LPLGMLNISYLHAYKSRRFFELVNIGIITYCVFSSEYVLLNRGRGDGLAIFDLTMYEHFRPIADLYIISSSQAPPLRKGNNI